MGKNMGNKTCIDEIVEQSLLRLHTLFLARVLRINGKYADVQPLSLVKAVGGTPKKQAVLKNVPVLQHLAEHLKPEDTVLCGACERDITETRAGKYALPVIGHHMISSSIVIGIL